MEPNNKQVTAWRRQSLRLVITGQTHLGDTMSQVSLLFVCTYTYCVACPSWAAAAQRDARHARKRSFVGGAAAKSMHFAGRQFVRVAVSLPVCVPVRLCDTGTHAAGCSRSVHPVSLAIFLDFHVHSTAACSVPSTSTD